MNTLEIYINKNKVKVSSNDTILKAARKLDIYIPVLCNHPDIFGTALASDPSDFIFQGNIKIENKGTNEPKGCGLCIVEIKGINELKPACSTMVKQGMEIETESNLVKEKRQEILGLIFSCHPHACLTCAQQEGCSKTQCSSNVNENERCCDLFGNCELQKLANHIGIPANTPKWTPTNLPILKDSPLYIRDYNLCIGCRRCVRICKDVRKINALGFVYDENNNIVVGTHFKTLEESGCRFCTACVHVCPTGAIKDKKSIRLKKEKDILPCKNACPAKIDIPRYLRLIAQEKKDEALAVIREKVPFPGVLGRICFHPCEDFCKRQELNTSISICTLKRYAAEDDKGLWKKNITIQPDTGKKVAVIGSGPAGLTCAFYLGKKGHKVTIFEAQSKLGGMLKYGIPSYRLPRNILDNEINDIIEISGIDIKTNINFGDDITIESLKDDGFHAIFIALGLKNSKKISFKGNDLDFVILGVDFLKQVNKGENPKVGNEVIVIGGGNVAIDVAMTCIRQNVEKVHIICLENKHEMPANDHELEIAKQEGIIVHNCLGPVEVTKNNILIVQECKKVFDENNKFNPKFNSSNKKEFYADQIILAAGQTSDIGFLDKINIKISNSLINVNEKDCQTSMENIYAGGDIVTGPLSVISAIAGARKAASAIDLKLGGNGDIEDVLLKQNKSQQDILIEKLSKEKSEIKIFASLKKQENLELDSKARCSNFNEIVLPLTHEQAKNEALRCLECDIRLSLKNNPSPPEKYKEFTLENINQTPETEGVYQLVNAEKNIIAIKGCSNLKQGLMQEFDDESSAVLFEYEENRMFSQRESELIQQYLQKHGEMPGAGDDDMDDLF